MGSGREELVRSGGAGGSISRRNLFGTAPATRTTPGSHDQGPDLGIQSVSRLCERVGWWKSPRTDLERGKPTTTTRIPTRPVKTARCPRFGALEP